MIKEIFLSALKNFQTFFVAWVIIIIINQLVIFGACFAPYCLMAALPHTFVISLLINYFILTDGSNCLENSTHITKEKSDEAQFIQPKVASDIETKQSSNMTLIVVILATVMVVGLIIWVSTKTTLDAPVSDITQEKSPVSDTTQEVLENNDECFTGTCVEAAETTILSSKAKHHVNEAWIVCGYIAEIKTIQGRTYLNMGSRYPNQEMAVVIWPDAAEKVQSALSFGGKTMCIYGKITEYKGTPQISLRDQSQIIK